jgi:hypothetical protein
MQSTAKRLAGIGAGAVLALGAAVLPANAAGLDKSVTPGDETNTYVRVHKTVTDAGGQDFDVSVLWTETYETASGNFRVGATLKINAIGVDLDTKDNPGDGGIDVTSIKVYNGYADGHVSLLQTKTIDGGPDPLNVNIANPLNRPNVSKVVVSGVGVDGDGKDGSGSTTIIQPVIGDEDPGADGEGPTDL